MSRFSARDWAKLGLDRLAAEGPSALTVDNICAAAGRSRGSLYHHFRDHRGFVAAVVAFWRERHTDAVIATIEAEGLVGSDAAEALNERALRLDFAVERGIRLLAAGRTDVRAEVERVDARRIAFIAAINEHRGIPEGRARILAELEYAAYVGIQHMPGTFSPKRLDQLYRELTKLVAAS